MTKNCLFVSFLTPTQQNGVCIKACTDIRINMQYTSAVKRGIVVTLWRADFVLSESETRLEFLTD